MLSLELFLALLLAAIVVVVLSARLRFAYTIALVLLGFGTGIIANLTGFIAIPGSVSELFSPNLFFDILLPPIVFEAAIHVNVRLLRRRLTLVLFLVIVGVVFTTIFAGVVVGYLTALPLVAALLLAAILSPTDPVAVVDLFRRLRVPEELSTIVESEALLNDAAGVILFIVLLGVASSTASTLSGDILQFGWLAIGGVVIGLLVAGGVYIIHRWVNDAAVETALTVVAAFGSFLVAQDVGASGIVSTAIAGIAFGTLVAPRAVDPAVRVAVSAFWRVVVYIANSIIFLAMGLLFVLSSLLAHLGLIVLVFVTLLLGRALLVGAFRAATARGPGSLPGVWYNVITLAGIRGAIPIVLALSLYTTPTTLAPDVVQAIVAAAFGVAFMSIIVGNLASDAYVKRHFPSATGPSD